MKKSVMFGLILGCVACAVGCGSASDKKSENLETTLPVESIEEPKVDGELAPPEVAIEEAVVEEVVDKDVEKLPTNVEEKAVEEPAL